MGPASHSDKLRYSRQIATFMVQITVPPKVHDRRDVRRESNVASGHSTSAPSTQCSSATAAAARGTGKAMKAGFDSAILQVFRADIPEKQFSPRSVSEWHLEHLIEVAIVNFALVTDT